MGRQGAGRRKSEQIGLETVACEGPVLYSQPVSAGEKRPTSASVNASEERLSPILVRPVREQLEHDRVIRLLQARYKRKFEVAVNPGNTQAAPVGSGPSAWYPDLVLQSGERTRKLLGVVEVETAESVNHLEAMSQWAAFARLRAPFHLYVPASNIDTAKRLVADLAIAVAEMWAYSSLGDQVRFTLVHRAPGMNDGRPRAAAASAGAPVARKASVVGRRPPARAAAKPSRPAATVKARSARKAVRRPIAKKSPARAQKRK
jgi:hypothetical protein